MSIFSIDDNKCKRDGICVEECPLKIIRLADQNSVPTPVPNAEELCIHCGHCVSICPHGALALKEMPPEKCTPIKKDLNISKEQAEQFLCSRRSIRVYKDKPVERETIEKMIHIASYGPTGHNSQTVEWLVVHDREDVKKFAGLVVDWMRSMVKEKSPIAAELQFDLILAGWEAGLDIILRDAPHLILAHAPSSDAMAPTSCTIQLSYLELAAASLGLGACWAGFLYAATVFWPPLQEELGLPEGHTCQGALMLGHPKFKYHRIPVRNTPKVKWK